VSLIRHDDGSAKTHWLLPDSSSSTAASAVTLDASSAASISDGGGARGKRHRAPVTPTINIHA
jgi:hypothetical protein